MALNVYFVERPSRSCSYDEYLNFVIVCPDEATARRTHPSGETVLDEQNMEWGELTSYPWCAESCWVKATECKNLIVTLLGVAHDGVVSDNNPDRAAGVKEGIVTAYYIRG